MIRLHHALIDSNVRHQLAVDGGVAPIDLLGKPVQLISGVDLVASIHQARYIRNTLAEVDAVLIQNLSTAQHGVRINADALTPDKIRLRTLQQICHLAGGEGIRSLAGGGACCVTDIAALGFAADAKLDLVAAILGAAGAVIAVGNCTGGTDVVTYHTTDIGVAADTAGVVAVADGAIGVEAHHAADRIEAYTDAAGVVAVADGAGVEARHAADIIVAADTAGVVAVADGAGVVVAHHAADKPAAADAAGVVAVADGGVGAVVVAHHAADIIVTLQVRPNDTHIFDGTHGAHIAKEAHITLGGIIEIQAGNGLVVAIEGSGVFSAAIADRGPDPEIASVAVEGAISVQDLLIDHDIRHQLAVDGRTTPINLCRKPIQLIGIINLIIAIHQFRLLGKFRLLSIHVVELQGVHALGAIVDVSITVPVGVLVVPLDIAAASHVLDIVQTVTGILQNPIHIGSVQRHRGVAVVHAQLLATDADENGAVIIVGHSPDLGVAVAGQGLTLSHSNAIVVVTVVGGGQSHAIGRDIDHVLTISNTINNSCARAVTLILQSQRSNSKLGTLLRTRQHIGRQHGKHHTNRQNHAQNSFSVHFSASCFCYLYPVYIRPQ